MSCNCTGVRTKSCSCKQAPAQAWLGAPVLALDYGAVAPCSREVASRRDSVDPRGLGRRLLEGFYDKCAGYNLRYCPLGRGHLGRWAREGRRNGAAWDLLVLTCFLLANSVVLINILATMTMHLYCLIRDGTNWITSRCMREYGAIQLSTARRLVGDRTGASASPDC